jgi:hypothetical protein
MPGLFHIMPIQQKPEIRQDGVVQPAGAAVQTIAMIAVVLLEDMVNPLTG